MVEDEKSMLQKKIPQKQQKHIKNQMNRSRTDSTAATHSGKSGPHFFVARSQRIKKYVVHEM